jgi:hypothetical protein
MGGGSLFPAQFFSGMITTGYLVLGLFFLRFWRRTRDALFIYFALAFWLLAVNQVASTFTNAGEFEPAWTYLIRLLAFMVLIAAIVRKNVSEPR